MKFIFKIQISMSIRKSIPYLCIFSMFLLGCEDPFRVPSAPSNQEILVVEGRIGNEETLIKLSRTTNLDSFKINPEVNAIVQIENELGNVVGQLNEIEAGQYFSDLDLTVNENYRIRIETNNQEIYQSDYSTLVLTPPISDLKIKVDTASSGIEVLLSTEDPNNNTRYYLWDYSETYEYVTKFTSVLEFDGEKVVPRSRDEQIRVCWKTDNSTDILVQSSVQFEKDVVRDRLIVGYDLAETKKFIIGYSILVNQYALSEEEYEFWSLLENNSESFGTLFDPQPSQLSTNIRCISDPEKQVIGFVGSSSKAEKRIYVLGRDLPRSSQNTKLFCTEKTIPLSEQDEIIRILSLGNFIPVDYVAGEIEALSYATKFCADCRVQGGTNVKPSFWF